MRRYLPAAICLIGMLTCAVLVRSTAPRKPDSSVEIIVHSPEGTYVGIAGRAID